MFWLIGILIYVAIGYLVACLAVEALFGGPFNLRTSSDVWILLVFIILWPLILISSILSLVFSRE